jgi:hypothetical protein
MEEDHDLRGRSLRRKGSELHISALTTTNEDPGNHSTALLLFQHRRWRGNYLPSLSLHTYTEIQRIMAAGVNIRCTYVCRVQWSTNSVRSEGFIMSEAFAALHPCPPPYQDSLVRPPNPCVQMRATTQSQCSTPFTSDTPRLAHMPVYINMRACAKDTCRQAHPTVHARPYLRCVLPSSTILCAEITEHRGR